MGLLKDRRERAREFGATIAEVKTAAGEASTAFMVISAVAVFALLLAAGALILAAHASRENE